MTYGIGGPLSAVFEPPVKPHKEPRTISIEDEQRLVSEARAWVKVLSRRFPDAREIDLLNAFLKVFSERTSG